MKKLIRYPRLAAVMLTIVATVFFLTKCVNKESKTLAITNAKGEQFAGSQSCASCHKDIYESHIKTAHARTSQHANDTSVKGSFETGKNTFAFNKSVVMAMEKRDGKLYQVEYFKGVEKRTELFDIAVGSGTKGQSFIYWNDKKLFQLPITYFTAANDWSNSPGFPDKVVFNRLITSRCLECHSTYAEAQLASFNQPETFDEGKLILGIECEKCHGAGQKHVEFQTQNPTSPIAKYIVNTGKLSRQQNLDMCALCHGGRLQKTKPSFTFSAGDNLSDFFEVDTTAPDADNIDVHGNQYGLLRASKCFRMSETLTCGSCHNTHENERGNTALFSQRCMSCHDSKNEVVCKLEKTTGNIINTNCIDCHMPVKASMAISVFLPGSNRATAALIRSHYVGIYPNETKKMLPKITEAAHK